MWRGIKYVEQLSDRLHSCVLTDCASLFCSSYRFLSQQCCGQAGKICPILLLQVNVNIASSAQLCVYVCVCVYVQAFFFHCIYMTVWPPSLPPADYVARWGGQHVCSAAGRVPGVCVWNGHQESLHHHHLWLSDQLHHENRPLPAGWVSCSASTQFHFSQRGIREGSKGTD